MTLSETQLEAMWRWARAFAEYATGPGEGYPGALANLKNAHLRLLAVESEETPAPRNWGGCECKCCGVKMDGGHFCSARCRDNYADIARQHSREASAPATRSVEEILERIQIHVSEWKPGYVHGEVSAALRLYREERAARLDLHTRLNDFAEAMKSERDTAVRERDEARERIEKALPLLESQYHGAPDLEASHCDICKGVLILRGEGGGTK
jgi:hypothetical protein